MYDGGNKEWKVQKMNNLSVTFEKKKGSIKGA